MAEEGLIPFLMLKAVLQAELTLLLGFPSRVNAGLEKLDKRSVCYGELRKYFCALTLNKCLDEACISKYGALRIKSLRKVWTESHSTCH